MYATIIARRCWCSCDSRMARRSAGRRARHVVQDPLAVVTLHDLFVAQDGVEDLRAQPDMADGADAVARFGHGDAVSPLRDELEDREHLGRHAGDDGLTLAGDARDGRSQLGELCRERLAVRLDGFLLRDERGVGPLHIRREFVGVDHQLEDLILAGLDFGLCEGDLVLDGVVFLVGLDRHGLLAEFRQTALVDGHVLLDLPARRLVGGQRVLGGGHLLARLFEPGVQASFAFGRFRQATVRVMGGRVEPLERNQPFEVSVHPRGHHCTLRPCPRRRYGMRTPGVKARRTCQGVHCPFALDDPAVPQHLAKSADGVELGLDRDEALPPERVVGEGNEIQDDVLWQAPPEQGRRHVFDEGPDHVSLAVIHGEVAAVPSHGRAHVPHRWPQGRTGNGGPSVGA